MGDRTCKEPDCDKPTGVSGSARGWCRVHYRQLRETPPCSVPGCAAKVRARGVCSTHYDRLIRTGSVELKPREPQLCSIEGCDQPHLTKGLCNKHRLRLDRHGSTDHVSDRTGPTHPRWAGDSAGYIAVHGRIHRRRGHANTHACVQCGEQADEWAYDHSDPNERRDDPLGRPYSTDPQRYEPLCFSCHRLRDSPRAAWRA